MSGFEDDSGGERLPVDRSGDPNQAHLLPIAGADSPVADRLVVLERGAPFAIEWTADKIVTGGVVAFPTDTVYGIGASLAHADALRRVFAIKRRPSGQPLPVLIASAAALDQIALDLEANVALFLARYWPGPLTAVVPAREGMPTEVVGPNQTVGARVPNHPLALELIERVGGAIAATSANRSGQPPARTAADVAAALGDDVDILLDGGVTPGGVPSTVVAFSGDDLRVLREGAIPATDLLAAWHELRGQGAGGRGPEQS